MRRRLCGRRLRQEIHQVAWCYLRVSGPQHVASITGMGSMVQESCLFLTGELVTYNVTVTYSLCPFPLHAASIPRKISSELQDCSLQSHQEIRLHTGSRSLSSPLPHRAAWLCSGFSNTGTHGQTLNSCTSLVAVVPLSPGLH